MGTRKTSAIALAAAAMLAASSIGVAAQDDGADPLAPRFFRQGDTHSSVHERELECGTRPDRDADLTRAFYLCEGTFRSTDPRLNGHFYFLRPERTPIADGTGQVVGDRGVRLIRMRAAITNDEGRWVGVYTWLDPIEPFLNAIESAESAKLRERIERDWQATPATLQLEGQGAYEGLTAYVQVAGGPGDEQIGLIFSGEMPELAGEEPAPLASSSS